MRCTGLQMCGLAITSLAATSIQCMSECLAFISFTEWLANASIAKLASPFLQVTTSQILLPTFTSSKASSKALEGCFLTEDLLHLSQMQVRAISSTLVCCRTVCTSNALAVLCRTDSPMQEPFALRAKCAENTLPDLKINSQLQPGQKYRLVFCASVGLTSSPFASRPYGTLNSSLFVLHA